jgi:hypothetical protein
MARDRDEVDEHGNPPKPIVGFSQWALGEQAVADLQAQFGETAPEEEVVAYLANQGHIRKVAEAVLRDVSAQHPFWVNDRHDYRTGFERRLRNAYGPGLDALETFIGLCADVVRDIYGRGGLEVTGEVLLDLHGRACLAAQEVHALLSKGFPQGALAAWRTIHETAVYASLLGEHGHEDDNRLTRRRLAFVDVERYRDAVIYQERAEEIDHEPIGGEEMSKLEAASEAASKRWGTPLKDRRNGWARELTDPAPATFDRLESLAGLAHLRGHYRWASHRVHADGRGNETNLRRRGDQVARVTGPTNTGAFVDAVDLTIGSLHVTTNTVLLNSRADAPHLGEVVAADLFGLMRGRIVEAFVEGHDIVTEAERLIIQEGVEEPLEDVSAWWPGTTGKGMP